MPSRIVLFLYTEFTGDNFWEIWSDIKSGAYHDEKMKKYASKELELYRKIFIEEGADKILDYYRASKGAFLCIQKNKRILHYGYIIKQSL